MSLTVIVGQPGSGKSKAIRERYLRSESAVFFDGHHDAEAVRQIRHEMGVQNHLYLAVSADMLWSELERLDGAREVFIDMPDLKEPDMRKLGSLARERNLHLTFTSSQPPGNLGEAEVVKLA
ncbi:MAG: hypothetical protein ACM3X6_09855 [Patescibacteria group bacterium]